MLALEDLATLYPTQTWLELPALEQTKARIQVETHDYSHIAATERAYYNRLCLNIVQPWLVEELDILEPSVVMPSLEQLPTLWEFFNGTRLILGPMRWVIIPIEATTVDELRVPQEWVDISDWAAHYYLAVHLNLVAGWLKIVGCATHRQLQQSANYDPIDRTYSISQSQLIQDLMAVTIAQAHFPIWQPTCDSLAVLTDQAAQSWIEQLSQTHYSPRLDLPFEQWAALIANGNWRQSLYQRRLAIATTERTPKINLSQWPTTGFAPGWQAISGSSYAYAQARGVDPLRRGQRIELGDRRMLLVVMYEVLTRGTQFGTPIVRIQLELRGVDEQPILPPALQFSVASWYLPTPEDPSVETVSTGSADEVVRLPRLIGIVSKLFSVTITWEEFQFTEEFMV
jgi:Protein of unknown function (DUF1822)